MREGAENRKYRVQGLVWKQQMLVGSVKLQQEIEVEVGVGGREVEKAQLLGPRWVG